MKDVKYMFVRAGSFDAAVSAFRIFVEEFWSEIQRLHKTDPQHPAVPALSQDGRTLDILLSSFEKCVLTDKDVITEIFGNDYHLLSQTTLDRFSFGFSNEDRSKLH